MKKKVVLLILILHLVSRPVVESHQCVLALVKNSNHEKHLSLESTKEQLVAVNLGEDESRASSVDNAIRKLVDDVVVVVTNLPSSVSSEILYKWFKLKCQGVKEASLKNKPGCGEVKFKSKIEMEKCFKRMDKTFWFGQKVRVRPKTPKKGARS